MFSPNQNRIRGPVRPCARGLNSVHNHLRAVRIRLSVGLLSGTAAQSQPRRGSDLRANSDPQPRVSPLLEAQSPADSPQQDRGLWLSFSPDPPASLCSANFPRVALFALFALFAPQLQNRTELNRTGSEQEERDKESRKLVGAAGGASVSLGHPRLSPLCCARGGGGVEEEEREGGGGRRRRKGREEEREGGGACPRSSMEEEEEVLGIGGGGGGLLKPPRGLECITPQGKPSGETGNLRHEQLECRPVVDHKRINKTVQRRSEKTRQANTSRLTNPTETKRHSSDCKKAAGEEPPSHQQKEKPTRIRHRDHMKVKLSLLNEAFLNEAFLNEAFLNVAFLNAAGLDSDGLWVVVVELDQGLDGFLHRAHLDQSHLVVLPEGNTTDGDDKCIKFSLSLVYRLLQLLQCEDLRDVGEMKAVQRRVAVVFGQALILVAFTGKLNARVFGRRDAERLPVKLLPAQVADQQDRDSCRDVREPQPGGSREGESGKASGHPGDQTWVAPGNADKLFRIRPVLEALEETFRTAVDPEEFQSIDEQMIPFKGRLSIKQYIPKKPKPWGVKVWVRAGSSGYMYRFEVYQGAAVRGQISQLGMAADVVIRLCDDIQQKNHKVFFDNFFTTIPLLLVLKSQGICGTGTCRRNRLHGAN
ncbi:hypothetical protein F7725_027315 [Dissostichus mawsoni]|uniref:PiggyBac transposable element-derived protein domain-containing protein n=1 Tax=Dissostichus mawsoni TaxID=36200 RepID=A0A7J5XDU0_DISMA|nr:hypothetical protein F7725_027315 [Dissostichus mawsoni]